MKKISFLLAILIILTTFPSIQVFASHNPYVGIEMTKYDEAVETSATFSSDNRGFVRNLRGSAYMVFKDVNFGENGPASIELVIGTDDANSGIVSIYIDKASGDPIVELQTFGTNWESATITAEISKKITGTHDVFIKNTSGVCNLYRALFYERAVAGAGAVFEDKDYFDDIDESLYRNEINMFYEMGILNGFGETTFEPKLFMSRGDFASVMYRLLGTGSVSGVSFADVDSSNPNSDAISWMYGAGLITGDENSLYRPYDFITTQEAGTIAVRALGFEKLAQEYGGYPNGYMNIASTEDLFDNISTDKYLTREQIAQFLYNFVHADHLDIESITSNGVKYIKSSGILEKKKGIYTDTGIVTANVFTGLKVANSNLTDDAVMIDGEKYFVGDTNASSLLGYETIFYYSEIDGKKVLTNIRPSSNAKVTKLSTEDVYIKTINESIAEYYDESGKLRKIKFDSDTAFIYNGKAADKPLSDLITNGDFRGRITYIQNSGTDVVLIEQHKTITIGSIDTVDMIIHNKEFTENFSFNSEDVDETLLRNNEAFSYARLTQGMVLSVFESKNSTGRKRIVAFVEDNVVSGTISSLTENSISINGVEYQTSFSDGTIPSVGLSGNFVINYLGEVVAYNTDSSFDKTFKTGILLEAAEYRRGFDNYCQLRIFTSDNKIEIFNCTKKVVADGITIDSPADLLSGKGSYAGLNSIEANSLLRYKLNEDNKIYLIDTYQSGSNDHNDQLTRLADASTTFCFNESANSFLNSSGKTMYVYDVSPEAFIFSLETDEEQLSYVPDMMNLLSREASAKGIAYSVTSGDMPIVDYFVWFDRNSSVSVVYSKPFVYEKTINVLNDDGAYARQIHGWCGSMEVIYTLTDDFLNDSENAGTRNILNSVRVGDTMRFKLDLNGNVLFAEMIYLHDGAESINGVTPLLNDAGGLKVYDKFQRTRFFVGEIVAKNDDFIKVECAYDGGITEELLWCGDASVITYSTTSNKINPGLSSTNLTVGDKVLICISDSLVALVLKYTN